MDTSTLTTERLTKLLERHGWVEYEPAPGFLTGDRTDPEDRQRLRGLLVAIAVCALAWAAIIFAIAAVIR